MVKLRAGRKVLVADGSTAARASVTKALRELGIGAKDIIGAETYDEALLVLEREQPRVILCEYHLGDRNGLTLAPLQRGYCPGAGERLFVLVTANARESAVAEAAEEEVDSYVLKPFTQAALLDRLMKAALAKVDPDPYRRAIEEGREYLRAEKPKQASACFEKATRLTNKPPLAYYYLGKARMAAGYHASAEEAFQAGLTFNERHFRCLTGMYELLLAQERLTEAYEVARKIVFTFPVNARKLDNILKLAARAKCYDEIEAYYEIYVEMDFRPPELVRCVTAALGVAGMYYLGRRETKRGIPLLKKSLLNSGRSPQIFREIVTNLCQNGQFAEAEGFLKEFPAEARQTDPTFAAMEFLVVAGSCTAAQAIDRGRKLLARGIHDPAVYERLVAIHLDAGLRPAAESLAVEGGKRWPELRERLLAAVGARG
jgi:CheY-like chemotaxis protein